MLMIMAFAFGGALVAHPRAQFEELAQHRLVIAGSPQPEPRGRLADIGTVETKPDALGHVHWLCKA